MPADLRHKLRRLGVRKRAARIGTGPEAAPGLDSDRYGIEALIDGRVLDTPHGPTFVREQAYAVEHVHGGSALGDLLELSPSLAAQIGREPALEEIELDRVAFVDTETTGLGRGVGTLVFLVGIGLFQHPQSDIRNPQSSFHIHQFFLRDVNEEAAMLHALTGRLEGCEALITFNGRGFDVPLLHSRFTLARMDLPLLRAPHLDLLMPARRMWRGRLPSCALSSLERHVLGVRRKQIDVRGYLIPQIYMDYLRTGDASEMPRVLYHNQIDILSMVSLAACLIRLFDPDRLPQPGSDGRDPERDAGDLLALGKWYAGVGRVADAETALQACLASGTDPDLRIAALYRLGRLLKRADRRREAVPLWESLSESQTHQGVEACVELAKYYEWHDVNLDRAAVWTREAIEIARGLPRGRFDAELAHRMGRLRRKRATPR